jgi:hypothetical protein
MAGFLATRRHASWLLLCESHCLCLLQHGILFQSACKGPCKWFLLELRAISPPLEGQRVYSSVKNLCLRDREGLFSFSKGPHQERGQQELRTTLSPSAGAQGSYQALKGYGQGHESLHEWGLPHEQSQYPMKLWFIEIQQHRRSTQTLATNSCLADSLRAGFD